MLGLNAFITFTSNCYYAIHSFLLPFHAKPPY